MASWPMRVLNFHHSIYEPSVVYFHWKRTNQGIEISFYHHPTSCPISASCKRSKTLFQISLLLFSTWREYFYSQPKSKDLNKVSLLLQDLDSITLFFLMYKVIDGMLTLRVSFQKSRDAIAFVRLSGDVDQSLDRVNCDISWIEWFIRCSRLFLQSPGKLWALVS